MIMIVVVGLIMIRERGDKAVVGDDHDVVDEDDDVVDEDGHDNDDLSLLGAIASQTGQTGEMLYMKKKGNQQAMKEPMMRPTNMMLTMMLEMVMMLVMVVMMQMMMVMMLVMVMITKYKSCPPFFFPSETFLLFVLTLVVRWTNIAPE